jgi:hypothetical protein
MKTIIITITLLLAAPAYATESFDITVHWTCEYEGCLIEQRDLAALYLNYQDEIGGEPNPVSKKQTIINQLVSDLQEMIKAGAARAADQYRVNAVETADANTSGITGE